MKNYKSNLRCKKETLDKVLNIEKDLQKVFDTFLDMIEDKEIKELVKEHCYFAGGCIYSTYIDNWVNDYDLWTDNKQILDKISSYFIKLHKDYDRNFEHIIITNNAITLKINTEITIQVITRWYGEPIDVISQFDFKHNMFAFINGKVIPFTSIRYLDTQKLCINFKRGRDLGNVLLRIPKMLNKGFKIYKDDHRKLLKMVLKNADQELKDIIDGEYHY